MMMIERDEDGYILIPKENYSDERYSYLEEVESTSSLEFATNANDITLEQLGHPNESSLYQCILSLLESQDRIPYTYHTMALRKMKIMYCCISEKCLAANACYCVIVHSFDIREAF